MLAKLIIVNKKMEYYTGALEGTNELRYKVDKLIACSHRLA